MISFLAQLSTFVDSINFKSIGRPLIFLLIVLSQLRLSLAFTEFLFRNFSVTYDLLLHVFNLSLPLLGHLQLLDKRHLLFLHEPRQFFQLFSLMQSLINLLVVTVTSDRVTELCVPHPGLFSFLFSRVDALEINLSVFQAVIPVFVNELFDFVLLTLDL